MCWVGSAKHLPGWAEAARRANPRRAWRLQAFASRRLRERVEPRPAIPRRAGHSPEGSPMIQPWETLESKPAGNFRIFTIRADRKRSPRTGREHDFVVLDCANWVNVIATTP